ncbi:unnamed protein product, partial [Phaeothamnion confervicola]
ARVLLINARALHAMLSMIDPAFVACFDYGVIGGGHSRGVDDVGGDGDRDGDERGRRQAERAVEFLVADAGKRPQMLRHYNTVLDRHASSSPSADKEGYYAGAGRLIEELDAITDAIWDTHCSGSSGDGYGEGNGGSVGT